MVTVRVEGGKELAAILRALPKSVSKLIQRETLIEAAEPIVVVARRRAPREPGAPDLADNIEVGYVRSEHATETMVAVGPVRGFFYGYFQEWGTVHHGAQPFMRPAFDEQKDRSLILIMRRLWDHVQSYVQARDVR